MNKYQIIAVSPGRNENYFYTGIEAPQAKAVFIIIEDNHADCLLSIKSFLKVNYFCYKCLIGYKHRRSHNCEYTCNQCFERPKCERENEVICKDCNRYFVSEKCYDNHKNNKICRNYKYCLKCGKIYTEKNHICHHKKCSICKEIVLISGHNCYIKPNDKEEIETQDNIT